MNEMTNVFKIFNQLQSTSKKTEKIEILKANKRNILFTDTLKMAFKSVCDNRNQHQKA